MSQQSHLSFFLILIISTVSFIIPAAYAAEGSATLTPTVDSLTPGCNADEILFCTIQAAIDAGISPTISVGFNAYPQTISLDSANSGLTLLGINFANLQPIITGEITFGGVSVITGITIENMKMTGGIRVTSGDVSGITLKNNIFLENTDAISITAGAIGILDARNNFWGDATGPNHPTNTAGLGNSISGPVLFTPFFTDVALTTLSTPTSILVNTDLTPSSPSAGKVKIPASAKGYSFQSGAAFDISQGIVTIPETTQTIGGISVTSQKKVTITTTDSGVLILDNSATPDFDLQIPHNTEISGPNGWDNQIIPPTKVASSGTAPSGFSVGSVIISVGSLDSNLILDSAATLILPGVTGNVGYKLAGSSQWIQITNTCSSFDNPTSGLVFPGECFISDGTDTKIATFHFTEFGELNPLPPKKSGGAGGDRTKPVLQSNTLSSPGSVIFGGSLSLDPSQPPETSLFEINDEVNLELSFFENQGPKTIQHVALYMNIRDFDTRNDSDLWIEWNKGQPITVYDPNGFLKDNADVTTAINDANLDMTFHVTFVKPMETSTIVLYFWDFSRNDAIVTFEDVWKIIQPEVIPEIQEQTDIEETPTAKKTDSKTLPTWFDKVKEWFDQGLVTEKDYKNAYDFLTKL